LKEKIQRAALAKLSVPQSQVASAKSIDSPKVASALNIKIIPDNTPAAMRNLVIQPDIDATPKSPFRTKPYSSIN
jgi:hypothetical protein